MAKAKITPAAKAAEVPVTALAVLPDHKLATTDDSGRPYIKIGFDLNPEGGEFNTGARLKLPRMKLLQTQSVELKKDTKVDGATAGMYYNNSTGEVFESFDAVPLYLFQERYYNVPKMSNNMVCTSRDGKGMFGTCLSGNYELHKIPSRIVREPETGREVEVGLCDRCPHSARAFGEPAACSHSKILVMAPYEFIQNWEEMVGRIENADDDGDLVSDIINALFTVGFKSTGLKAFNQIADQGARDMSYFRWSWIVNTTPMSNDKGSWDQPTVFKNNKLTQDELIFARSLYKLAMRIRPVITDVEIVEDDGVVDGATGTTVVSEM